MGDSYNKLIEVKNELARFESVRLKSLSRFHITTQDLLDGEISKFLHLREEKDIGLMPPLSSNRNKSDRLSITSSATCIKAIIASNKHMVFKFEKFIDALFQRLKINDISTTGLKHGNPFTVGLLLPLLLDINSSSKSTELKKLIFFCVKQAKNHLKQGGVGFINFPEHGYLTYYNLLGLHKAKVNVLNECKLSIEWSLQELYKQISYFEANDEEEADVFQLGYNLLIQHAFNRSSLRDSIINLCLEIIFNAQLERGVWEKKTPLFNYSEKGDAFPFSFELLNAIFYEFHGVESKLVPFEMQLIRSFEWIKKNAKIYSEAEGGGGNIFLWKSVSRHVKVSAESWATSEVYLFIHNYRNYISNRIQNEILVQFDGKIYQKPDINVFNELALPNVSFRINPATYRLDEFFISHIFNPLKNPDGKGFSLANKPMPDTLMRSGIFFGPPGTGKTTYAKRMAMYLGWPLVIINPSDFAIESITLMPKTASDIFNKLLELEDTVIFFDEMEALINKRIVGEQFEQNFLTTTFLPKLQTLHDKAKSIFLVATNFLDRIDEAATREGRFDFKIQILHPSTDSKYKALKANLHKNGLDRKYQDVIKILEYSEDQKLALKYSTRKEFERLINLIVKSKCKEAEIKKEIGNLLLNYALKTKVDQIIKEGEEYNTRDN